MFRLNEVGSKNFNRGTGSLSNGQDALIEMLGAAIRQVIASHTGNDDMLEP